jgi:hypothetical protein
MFTRVMVHPDVGRQGEVAGGFGAETVLLGLPGRPRPAPALGKLFRHGVLVKAHPRLLWEDRYLTGPSRRDLGYRGNAIIRIAWPPPRMLC